MCIAFMVVALGFCTVENIDTCVLFVYQDRVYRSGLKGTTGFRDISFFVQHLSYDFAAISAEVHTVDHGNDFRFFLVNDDMLGIIYIISKSRTAAVVKTL